MKEDITALFVCLDDFCITYEKAIKASAPTEDGKRNYKTRVPGLSLSEILTIILMFQRSSCRNFKHFYQKYLPEYDKEFPGLCGYNRFIQLMPRALTPLAFLLNLLSAQSEKTGLYFADSTRVPVCHNKRIFGHKVFSGYAARGKSTMGWFFGFKLHIVINHKGEIMAARLTSGNMDDREPLPELVQALKGLLFADKGYISSELFHELFEEGLKLITPLKRKMKPVILPVQEKILLRKRAIIETVNGVLKETFQLVHTRHRSVKNFLVHIGATLVAYSLKSKKPSIRFSAA